MYVVCNKCGYEFERNNIYGTRCPKCNNLIKPDKKPKFIEENEEKLKKLRSEFLNKWRR